MDTTKVNESLQITQLNDDVLLEILSRLSIFDGINFMNSCHRMRNLSELYAKKFANFDFTSMDKSLTLKELNQLFQLIGKSLMNLDMSKMNLTFKNGNALVKAVTKWCRKLQELNMKLPYFTMLDQPLPKGLKSLTIYSYEFENDSIAEKLLKNSWKSLQTLRIFDMAFLNGSFLDKFQNLQDLQLENWPALMQNSLSNCLRQNKTLRILTIKSCPQISESMIARLSVLLPALEILNVDIFSKASKISCGPLSKLEHLKVLRMPYYGTASTAFVNSLISAISTNKCLQELYINGAAWLNVDSMKSLLAMKNLQKLEFSDCPFVDKAFLMMLGDNVPLNEVTFSRIKNLNDDALLAFAVKTTTLKRLQVLLCPVSLKVKTEIAAIIQHDVDCGKRSALIVNIERPVI